MAVKQSTQRFVDLFGESNAELTDPLYRDYVEKQAKSARKNRSDKTEKWLQNEENVESMLDFIAQGGALTMFCKSKGLAIVVVRKFFANPENGWSAQYEEAKLYRGDAIAEQIEDVVKRVEGGLIEPKTGKTVIDSKRWLAATYNHKYSDKTQVEHNVNVTVQSLHRDAIRSLADERNEQWQANIEEDNVSNTQDYLPNNRFEHSQ